MDYKYQCFKVNDLFTSFRQVLFWKRWSAGELALSNIHVHVLNISINLLLKCISIPQKTLKPFFRKLLYSSEIESTLQAFLPQAHKPSHTNMQWVAQGIKKKLEELCLQCRNLDLKHLHHTLPQKIGS